MMLTEQHFKTQSALIKAGFHHCEDLAEWPGMPRGWVCVLRSPHLDGRRNPFALFVYPGHVAVSSLLPVSKNWFVGSRFTYGTIPELIALVSRHFGTKFPTTVYILSYFHRHGTDLDVFLSLEGAQAEAVARITERISEDPNTDHHLAWLLENKPAEAIRRFNHHQPGHWDCVEEIEVFEKETRP